MTDLITDLREAAQYKSLSLRNRDLMMRAAETIKKLDEELRALKIQTYVDAHINVRKQSYKERMK